MQATWQLPLAMRKLQLRGDIHDAQTADTWQLFLWGGKVRGGGTEAGWVKWADRQIHLPSMCCVPRHVFKWHRLHFNSDIIHKCGTACRLQKRKAKVALPQEGNKGEGDRQRCTQNSQREREKESERKTKHLATICRSPRLSCQVQDLRAGTTGTTLAKGQGLKAAHTRTPT